MKNHLITAAIILSVAALNAHAQDNKTAKQLVDEGVALNDSGKYTQAIERYNSALKADPTYLRADYELGYTLYSSGKGMDAIPYLEKVVAQPGDLDAQTCDLLGSIYDDNKQPDKAIEYFKKGIAIDPKFERLHFNLGISYLRQKQYDAGEAEEIEAIKLDPKHASAQRMYGIAEYEKGNKTQSLIIWCSFLLLEPQSARSAGAFKYVYAILNDGVKYNGPKKVTITIPKGDMKPDDLLLQMTVVNSMDDKSLAGRKLSTPVDTLSVQLTAVFKMQAQSLQNNNDFFSSYFAKYFGQLANSGNMDAFSHLVSLTTYKDENIAWFKENKKQLDDLSNWVQITPRNF
jgi:tetratricopeptide (TPR) repeat protein